MRTLGHTVALLTPEATTTLRVGSDGWTITGELVQSREQTRALFAALTPEQWARAGVHPESGPFTLTDAVVQMRIHEAIDIEQIAKILAQ